MGHILIRLYVVIYQTNTWDNKEIDSPKETTALSSTSIDDIIPLDTPVTTSMEPKFVVPYSKWIVVKCFSCDASDSVYVARVIPVSQR